MSNAERFDQAIDRKDYLGAALLATGFSAGCASKNNAWNWAEDACRAAALAGVTIDPGKGRWPDLDKMEAQIKAARKEETCHE